MTALWLAASRDSAASRLPIRRAGTTKTGSRMRATTVICHEMLSITTSVRVRVTRLLTTPDSVPLNARWAPSTSLLSRLTSAPVRVRVKNAIGMRWTWSKTVVRRSRIKPSPIVAESQRVQIASAASATAIRAIRPAMPKTLLRESPLTIALTTWPARTGVATARHAETTLNTRKWISRRLCGAAKPPMRLSVSLVSR